MRYISVYWKWSFRLHFTLLVGFDGGFVCCFILMIQTLASPLNAHVLFHVFLIVTSTYSVQFNLSILAFSIHFTPHSANLGTWISWKEPTRCNRVVEFIIPVFLNCSTCFGRHTAHRRDLINYNYSLWFYIRLWLQVVAMPSQQPATKNV